jgi:hypothetical protein
VARRIRVFSSSVVAQGDRCIRRDSDQTNECRLRTVGRAGGVGAARHRREYERLAKTPIAAIRASDTALTKAGVEQGG